MSLADTLAPLLHALFGRPPVAPADDWLEALVGPGAEAAAVRAVADSGALYPHFRYRHFSRPKADGGRRDIAEPDARLKRLQQVILARHLGDAPHPAAVAYRPKRSVADHVWPHAGAAWLVAADVADFFPSTRADRVEEWWRGRLADRPARLLTLLTTHRGALPQGAPTSPALSNLVNRELDERLAARAAAAGACYTRYCDDMVFSGRDEYGPPSDLEAAVRSVLHGLGYRLHPVKGWRVYQRRDEPEITGLILTRRGRIALPERIVRSMRSLAFSSDARAAVRLSGYRAYAAMVRKRPRRESG